MHTFEQAKKFCVLYLRDSTVRFSFVDTMVSHIFNLISLKRTREFFEKFKLC